jgi:hypothetical protein
VIVELAGFFQVQEMTRLIDHDHARRRSQQAFGPADQVRADAAITGSVQVQRGPPRPVATGLA